MSTIKFIDIIRHLNEHGENHKSNPNVLDHLKKQKEKYAALRDVYLHRFNIDVNHIFEKNIRTLTSTGGGAGIAESSTKLNLTEPPRSIIYPELGVPKIDGISYATRIPNVVPPVADCPGETGDGSPTEIELTPYHEANFKRTVAYNKSSKLLWRHLDPNDPDQIRTSEFLEMHLLASLEYKEDDILFNGDGANEPTGIKNNANVSTASATNFGWNTAVSIKKTSRTNGSRSNRFWCMHPDVAAELEVRPRADGSDRFIIEDNKLNGDPVAVTPQISTADLFFGDFSVCKFLQFGKTGALINPYSIDGTIEIILLELIDLFIGNPSSIVYASNFS